MTSVGVARQTADGTRLSITVIPRASRTAVDGVRAGRLVIRVTAPPVDLAANIAVIAALSDWLRVPKRSITIVAGATSRRKDVLVKEVAAADVLARISARGATDGPSEFR